MHLAARVDELAAILESLIHLNPNWLWICQPWSTSASSCVSKYLPNLQLLCIVANRHDEGGRGGVVAHIPDKQGYGELPPLPARHRGDPRDDPKPELAKGEGSLK